VALIREATTLLAKNTKALHKLQVDLDRCLKALATKVN